ncbi:MAG TPA: UDP-N-acetylmuramoyl-L-alanine--D-glutamate ligase [Gemmatimonadaceae bacterium]|nr:UDP-N-acetylmuramoyl-L-alanine--D-glutamate ligase [Gemmatimonadaceae bacterium]
MTPDEWRRGEVAVIGLGRSGDAVSRLLRAHRALVYASDAGAAPSIERVAEGLRAVGVDASAGGHDLARIARSTLVVTSPGVPGDAPPLATAREARVPIVSELEIALGALPGARIIAITGTNGKSTVTAVVGHLLAALGLDVEVAGNIGRPLSEVALRAVPPAWVALEVSSYQLHDTPSLAPTVGVLTNLAPDHLDRYHDVEAYFADKRLLFRNAQATSQWVVNADDARAMVLAAGAAGITLRFSADGRLADAFYDRPHGALILLDAPLMKRVDLPLHGDHNVGNALAAALAVAAADPAHGSLTAREKLAAGLRSVRPLPHRLETVGEIHGVLWIDDSKATNVASARVGIAGMTRPTVLLLGGRHKGEPYAPLIDPIRRHAKAVLAYGESAELIVQDLGGSVPVERVTGDFASVVERARALAVPGDCVLLSPACASFDMFANYEERGAAFAALAQGGRAVEGVA